VDLVVKYKVICYANVNVTTNTSINAASSNYSGQNCSDLFGFDNCEVCSSSSCLSCPSGMDLTSPTACDCTQGTSLNGTCLPEGCVSATTAMGNVTVCLSCNDSLYNTVPYNGSCQCKYLLDGVCTQVFSAAECSALNFTYCEECTESACLSCPVGMSLTTTTLCGCTSGLDVNGSCVPEGCQSYAPALGTVSCLACNSTMYELLPVNGACQCRYLQGGVCVPVLQGDDCQAMGFIYCAECTASACLSCPAGMNLTSPTLCQCTSNPNINGSCVP
jgi:hypothetical protein